jgi:hypothetical protein
MVALAVVCGILAVFTHRARLWGAPVGVAVAMLGLVGLVLLARAWVPGRAAVGLVGVAFGLPWLAGAVARPEGDLLVAADGLSIAALGSLSLVLMAALALPAGSPDRGYDPQS